MFTSVKKQMNYFEHNDSFIVTKIEYNDKFEYKPTNSACVVYVLLIISSCYFHVIFTVKVTSSWRWRKLCCLPNILFFELCYAAALVGAVVLTIYILDRDIPK